LDIENNPDTYSVDLGGGCCVNFNTPNRAIEEFDFYTVIRTTQPDIRSIFVGDPILEVDKSTAVSSLVSRTAAEAARAEANAKRAEAKAEETKAEAEKALEVSDQAAKDAHEIAKTAAQTPTAVTQVLVDYVAKIAADKKEAAEKAAELADAVTASAEDARAVADDAAERTARAEEAQQELAAIRAEAEARAKARVEEAQAALSENTGRVELNDKRPIDWDSTPRLYQAVTFAHGHLLHFKQTWYADGYSLGDLLYSLPLGPGQKKMVSVLDWERREQNARTETTTFGEQLNASMGHDRDLSEVVTGALTESSRGGSKSTSVGIGAGTGAAGNGSYQGFNFGALLGVSGGYGGNDSSAWQDSSRNIASESLQSLRDRTLQSASAIRSLRSSVVGIVSQGEAVRATTEVVANHNHCHAITIQYFEILRHLKLVHELTDVQECLFIPFPMTNFDRFKAIRWRQPLESYLQRPELRDGFDAARRVETGWSEVDYPLERYADEIITSISGELQLTVIIPLPPFPERPQPRPEDKLAEIATAMTQATNPTAGFLGILTAIATGGASLVAGAATKSTIEGARALASDLYALPTAQERYNKFQQEVMPGLVEGFVNQLELWALVGKRQVEIVGADFTLVSDYQPGVPLRVSVQGTIRNRIRRGDVTQLIIRSANGLPNGCVQSLMERPFGTGHRHSSTYSSMTGASTTILIYQRWK